MFVFSLCVWFSGISSFVCVCCFLILLSGWELSVATKESLCGDYKGNPCVENTKGNPFVEWHKGNPFVQITTGRLLWDDTKGIPFVEISKGILWCCDGK